MGFKSLLLVLTYALVVQGLDNGLGLTPPMGWLSWARFMCNVDCESEPTECINERLYMDMADRLVADGFKDAGYQYVNIDDCWMEKERDENGRLKPDKNRFPSGIKNLADYVHSKGLKLGIYQDVGTNTCAGYPGSYGYVDVDAATFAEWGIDMLKVDGCYADAAEMDVTYPSYTEALNKTGRPILYSCEWPLYLYQGKIKPNYTQIAQYCNTWRNFGDVEDSWQNILRIVDFYADNQDEFVAAVGPGRFSDPDMVLGGNFGLSYEEAKAQFLLWAVMASPLLMSNDLRTLDPVYRSLFLNREVIAVNQDSLGMMGKRVYSKDQIEVWARPITPISDNGKYSYAVVFFNRRTLGGPVKLTIKLSDIGLNNYYCYHTYEAFDADDLWTHCPENDIRVTVNPSGATMIIAKVKK